LRDGSIPDDHPLSAAGSGAPQPPLKRLLAEADVVLGLGCRFEEMETNWRPGSVPAPGACYIQVDIEPREIGRSVPARIGLVGDIRRILEQLIAAVEGIPGALPPGAFSGHSRTAAVAAELAVIDDEMKQLGESEQRPLHPVRVIRAIREAFPRETTVAIDVGCITQHIAGGMPFFRVFEPRSLIVPSSFYSMGFAAAGLPAAKLVYPDRPAVGFVGEGSFQMVLNVLPVAAEHRLAVTWCVFNDGALGSIRDIQQYRFEQRILGTEFTVQPDFARSPRPAAARRARRGRTRSTAHSLAHSPRTSAGFAVLDFVVARERLLQTSSTTLLPGGVIERHRLSDARKPSDRDGKRRPAGSASRSARSSVRVRRGRHRPAMATSRRSASARGFSARASSLRAAATAGSRPTRPSAWREPSPAMRCSS
jgi:acetolactate synthase-1/2/3 large subunit